MSNCFFYFLRILASKQGCDVRCLWIERSFQDAKNECGLGDYQARKWRSWHHHMTMVMLAMLFLLEQRLLYKEDIPLLSCVDVVVILSFLLPQRALDTDELFRQMKLRHKKRLSAIESAYRKQGSGVAVEWPGEK